MLTLEQFLKKYLGGSWGYPEGKYVGECLSVCKLYIKECFGINPPASGSGSAYGYWSNFPNPLGEIFEKVLNTDDLIPQKGWIGIMEAWDTNPYGHIFIVADGSTKTICKNWAQNWSSKTFQLESNKYTHIIGYLKPKSIINDMTDEQKRVLELLENYKITAGHGNLEGAMNTLIGTVTTLRNTEETVSNQKKEIEAFKKQSETDNGAIKTLEEQLKMANTVSDGLKTTISDQYKEMDKKNLEYGELLEKYNTLLPKYEELLKNGDSCQTSEPTANNEIDKTQTRDLIVIVLERLVVKIKNLFKK